MQNTHVKLYKAVIAFSLAALFLCYEMAIQVAPGIMVSPMMQDLNLNAEHIGWIGSSYFYAYCLMQIPVGLLFDRYPVGQLLLFSLLWCVGGQICFTFFQGKTYFGNDLLHLLGFCSIVFR